MTTVAIIGADGAGKTTITQALVKSFPRPIKYIYMGANIESSNVSLPTSKLILYLKLRSFKKTAKRKGISDPNYVSTHHEAHRNKKYGSLGSLLRLVNRLAEGAYRQLVAWVYQLRGYIIVYDRHFLFDSASTSKRRKFADRVYHWVWSNLYPEPNLVIFLDAPPEVLFARKGEGTLEYLQKRRETYLAQGEKTGNFVRVDASRPFDQVLADVSEQIMGYDSAETPQPVHGSRQNG